MFSLPSPRPRGPRGGGRKGEGAVALRTGFASSKFPVDNWTKQGGPSNSNKRGESSWSNPAPKGPKEEVDFAWEKRVHKERSGEDGDGGFYQASSDGLWTSEPRPRPPEPSPPREPALLCSLKGCGEGRNRMIEEWARPPKAASPTHHPPEKEIACSSKAQLSKKRFTTQGSTIGHLRVTWKPFPLFPATP